MKRFRIPLVILIATACVVGAAIMASRYSQPDASSGLVGSSDFWVAPDTNTIPRNADGDRIRYGRKLIANTSYYLGPKGKVRPIINPMNCQNCHIDAGTKLYGNNFSAVASLYPVYKPRSGKVETVIFRINDCMQRSMNGQQLDSTSAEMKALEAYIKWVGKDVKKGIRPAASGTVEIPWMTRAADTLRGKIVYQRSCKVCHGKRGEGLPKISDGYQYPPLWGSQSYNTAAGIYRLGRFAGFVKYNMPLGASFDKPELTDEEAWDVAAFVNSQTRPVKFFAQDWPELKKKAIDFPFGPHADSFSEAQHKYGPFGPIKAAR